MVRPTTHRLATIHERDQRPTNDDTVYRKMRLSL